MRVDRVGARRPKSDRGASAVEYGLVLALFVVAVLGSIEVLHDDTSDFYRESGDGIGAVPTWSLDATTVTGGGPTTTAPATTTTAGPTTTGGPTTTASTTTTTATATYSFIAQLQDQSQSEPDGDWRARARVTIERDDVNPAVEGATVTGRFTTDDGDVKTGICVTNSSGHCYQTWDNRNSADSPTLFEVTNVIADPVWDGSPASIALVEP